MRKLIMLIVALVMATGAKAQYLNEPEKVFQEETIYIGASLSGLSLTYNKDTDFSFGVEAKGGYMFIDDWMVTARVGFTTQKSLPNTLRLGAGVRYYFERNGIFLNAGASYAKQGDYKDFKPEIGAGYAFFLSRTVTVEPELYYEFSTKQSRYNTLGLRIGFGVYL